MNLSNHRTGRRSNVCYLGLTPKHGFPQTGRFLVGNTWSGNTATGIVDANGETIFIFGVGMQPGNNYRIVASVIDESMYAGVQADNPEAAKYIGPAPSQTGGAPASPLLTVWRKLWVENDSMEAIPLDKFSYKKNNLGELSTVMPGEISNAWLDNSGNNTWLTISKTADRSSFNDLQNGNIIFQSLTHEVVGTRSDDYDYVLVPGDYISVPLGSSYRLYDDDDEFLDADPLPHRSFYGGNFTSKPIVNDQLKNYFRPAFVEIFDAVEYNNSDMISFRVNEVVSEENPVTIVDDLMDIHDKNPCWVCPITVAYQREMEADHDGKEDDGDDEDYGCGETAPHGNVTSSSYYDHSTIFIETCRECYDNQGGLRSSNPDTVQLARNRLKIWVTAIAAHEMGHQPGVQVDDHWEGWLMSKGCEDVSISNPGVQKFSAQSILRFRKTNRWSK